MEVDKAVLKKADRYGASDRSARAPELDFMRSQSIAVFGLGCVGAPSAIEFARAGAAKLWLVDHDTVDAATTIRWPLGLTASGLPKTVALQRFIEANYPGVEILPNQFKVGAVRFDEQRNSQCDFLRRVLSESSLIYDATTERGVQHLLAVAAKSFGLPYVSATGTAGGWGGDVFRIAPGITEGCWLCLQHMFQDAGFPVPTADALPDVQPAGCGDPTFRAAGFDMTTIAMMGVRTAISTLSQLNKGGYPWMDWDGMVVRLRDESGRLIPFSTQTIVVRKHSNCSSCRGV